MFQAPVELIECQSLYNILNEGIEYSRLTDPNYLYLLDCRDRRDYNESHIICAKRLRKEGETGVFKVPDDAELECRNLIVVYDGTTSNIQESSDAIELARYLYDNGSKNTVRVLKGGYELFSRLYPFLRTQQVIYMPRELEMLKTYPSEIIPGLLYLGNSRHANESYIKKDLKLKSYVNCTKNDSLNFNDKTVNYFEIPIDDSEDASISEYISDVCSFIDSSIRHRKQACLIYSDLGISRSAAIVILYLVYSQRLTIEEAFNQVLKCRKIQPQIRFLNEINEKLIKQQQTTTNTNTSTTITSTNS